MCSQDGGFQGWRNAYRPPRPTSPVSQRLGARDRKWWPRRHRSCLCHEPSTQFRVQARRSGPCAVLPNHKFSRYLRSTCPVTSTGLRAEDTGTETALSLKEHTRSPVRGGLRPQRWPCRGTGMLGGSPGCSQACRGSRLSRGGVGGGSLQLRGTLGLEHMGTVTQIQELHEPSGAGGPGFFGVVAPPIFPCPKSQPLTVTEGWWCSFFPPVWPHFRAGGLAASPGRHQRARGLLAGPGPSAGH